MKKKIVNMPFFLKLYEQPNISWVIPLSKKDANIDIWENTGPLLHLHSQLNMRNIGTYQICINTDN